MNIPETLIIGGAWIIAVALLIAVIVTVLVKKELNKHSSSDALHHKEQ